MRFSERTNGYIYNLDVKFTVFKRLRLRAPEVDGATIIRAAHNRVDCASHLNRISSSASASAQLGRVATWRRPSAYRFQCMGAMESFFSRVGCINLIAQALCAQLKSAAALAIESLRTFGARRGSIEGWLKQLKLCQIARDKPLLPI